MISDTEINKACAKLMGIPCWHENPQEFMACGKWHHGKELHGNPDPLNSKSDWADLVFYVVNEWDREKLKDFMRKRWVEVHQILYPKPTNKFADQFAESQFGLDPLYLKDQRALPTALAIWWENGG